MLKPNPQMAAGFVLSVEVEAPKPHMTLTRKRLSNAPAGTLSRSDRAVEGLVGRVAEGAST